MICSFWNISNSTLYGHFALYWRAAQIDERVWRHSTERCAIFSRVRGGPSAAHADGSRSSTCKPVVPSGRSANPRGFSGRCWGIRGVKTVTARWFASASSSLTCRTGPTSAATVRRTNSKSVENRTYPSLPCHRTLRRASTELPCARVIGAHTLHLHPPPQNVVSYVSIRVRTKRVTSYSPPILGKRVRHFPGSNHSLSCEYNTTTRVQRVRRGELTQSTRFGLWLGKSLWSWTLDNKIVHVPRLRISRAGHQ